MPWGSRWGAWISGIGLVMAVAACGGAPATATPLPAAVRPDQPTPVYPASTAFTLATPVLMPTVATPPQLGQGEPASATATSSVFTQPLDLTQIQSPPTGVGIVRSGAGLLAAPNGATLVQLPAGAVVTLTGKAANDAWVAAYTEEGITGWLAVNQVALFGAETLPVVTTAWGPGLAATLVAEAMKPVAMPTIVLTLTITP